MAFLALASFGVGLLTAWAGAALPAGADGVGLAALFVIAELAALLAARDPFWNRPLSRLAEGAEVFAIATATYAGALLLTARFAGRFDPQPLWATSLALLVIGLLTADLRRYQGTPRPFGLTLLRGGSCGHPPGHRRRHGRRGLRRPRCRPAAGGRMGGPPPGPGRQFLVRLRPSAALLGGLALIERLAGGAGWHGLVAGAVGLTAVALGAGDAWPVPWWSAPGCWWW